MPIAAKATLKDVERIVLAYYYDDRTKGQLISVRDCRSQLPGGGFTTINRLINIVAAKHSIPRPLSRIPSEIREQIAPFLGHLDNLNTTVKQLKSGIDYEVLYKTQLAELTQLKRHSEQQKLELENTKKECEHQKWQLIEFNRIKQAHAEATQLNKSLQTQLSEAKQQIAVLHSRENSIELLAKLQHITAVKSKPRSNPKKSNKKRPTKKQQLKPKKTKAIPTRTSKQRITKKKPKPQKRRAKPTPKGKFKSARKRSG